MIGHGVRGALGNVHADHLGNDLTGLLEQDGVTDAHIFFGDEILVVEGGVGDGGARQLHRFGDCLRGQDAGTSHLHHDVQHLGWFLLRWVFPRYRPTGEFGGAAEQIPLAQVVDLHHCPVHLIGKVVALPSQPVDLRLHLSRVGQHSTGNDQEAELF